MLLLFLMQSRNKFRKSDISMKCLESIITNSSTSRLRSSLSTNTTCPLDLQNYRATISSNQLPFENPYIYQRQEARSTTNLRDQLSLLQEKLNSAKRQLNKTHHASIKKQMNNKEAYFLKIKPTLTKPPQVQQKPAHEMKKSQIEQYSSSEPKPNNITTFSVNPYSSIKNNNYYLTEVIRARHEKNSLAVEHINTSIFILEKCRNLKKVIQQQEYQPIILPKIHQPNLKTLYLDLDETLIHCFDNSESQPDFKLNITIEGNPVSININIRPYALTFLKKVSKKWEVVVFTASHKDYADAILNEIDPDGILFHHRLYRQHCTLFDEIYIKDLSRINRDLSRAVLVDNAAYSYCLQLANGIPILPYYDGKDFELSALEGYLTRLQKCEDVRTLNQSYFKLQQYANFDNSMALIERLYLSNQT